MANFLQSLSAAQWIDLSCAIAAVVAAIVGAIRGFSGHIASLLSAMAATGAGFFLHPAVRAGAGRILQGSPVFAAVVAFLACLFVAILVFLLVRLVARKLIHAAVQQPADAILGLIAGLVHVFLAMLVAAAAFRLLPDCAARRAVCEKSVAGRACSAVVARFFPAGGGSSKP